MPPPTILACTFMLELGGDLRSISHQAVQRLVDQNQWEVRSAGTGLATAHHDDASPLHSANAPLVQRARRPAGPG
ncbi:hypothetical protein [Micromonospora sp. NPDC047187]|uniref:hypothetical protein n=1 Tax=Micromonospora sp. NPDC047187 TaxID=3155262 RepID=UPI0033EB482C